MLAGWPVSACFLSSAGSYWRTSPLQGLKHMSLSSGKSGPGFWDVPGPHILSGMLFMPCEPCPGHTGHGAALNSCDLTRSCWTPGLTDETIIWKGKRVPWGKAKGIRDPCSASRSALRLPEDLLGNWQLQSRQDKAEWGWRGSLPSPQTPLLPQLSKWTGTGGLWRESLGFNLNFFL